MVEGGRERCQLVREPSEQEPEVVLPIGGAFLPLLPWVDGSWEGAAATGTLKWAPPLGKVTSAAWCMRALEAKTLDSINHGFIHIRRQHQHPSAGIEVGGKQTPSAGAIWQCL